MSEQNLQPSELEKLIKIARTKIPSLQERQDLEQHFNDSDDFYDIAVWCLKDALVAAYNLGKTQSKQTYQNVLSEEYIERGALLIEIHRNPAEAHNERCAQILEAILEAPAVEVAEVKHGQWINDGDDWFCNRCGHNALCDKMTGEEVLSDICPHCGALMDENKTGTA